MNLLVAKTHRQLKFRESIPARLAHLLVISLWECAAPVELAQRQSRLFS